MSKPKVSLNSSTLSKLSSMSDDELSHLSKTPVAECEYCYGSRLDTSGAHREFVHGYTCAVIAAQNEIKRRHQQKQRAEYDEKHGEGAWNKEQHRLYEEARDKKWAEDFERIKKEREERAAR